jgi:prophage DNA circulation protein
MGIVSGIKDFLGLGDPIVVERTNPGYRERLREQITLTSPLGNEFNAKWIKNPRSGTKKLGIFDYAKIKGTVVQDLGNTGERMPMTIYFDGPDNDQEADRFFTACLETGQWEMIHPTKGFRGVKLIAYSEAISPVLEGGYTAFQLQWIEDLDPSTLKTTAQLRAEQAAGLDELNDASADQFASNISTDTLSERTSIIESIGKITDAVDSTLGKVAAVNNAIDKRMGELQRGIQGALRSGILEPIALANQLQQLVQLPALAITDVKARLNAYADFADEVFGVEPSSPNSEGANAVASKELALVSSIGALSTIAITGIASSTASTATATNTPTGAEKIFTGTTVQTQVQVIESIENIQQQFIDIAENLDANQVEFEVNTIDGQFFSQKETFPAAALLTNTGVEYLLVNFFDLKIEKTIILDQPKTPWQVALEEYGGPGTNDSNLDLLITSNKLKKDELLLLTRDTELVIYV